LRQYKFLLLIANGGKWATIFLVNSNHFEALLVYIARTNVISPANKMVISFNRKVLIKFLHPSGVVTQKG
jgi:hypothetical protein